MSKSRQKKPSFSLRKLSSEIIKSGTSKQKTKKLGIKKASKNLRRLSSEIIKSANPKQRKEISMISFGIKELHENLIQYKEKGQLKEFFRDVCNLSKEGLLDFCKLLKLDAGKSLSYEEICNKIVDERPNLFKLLTFNKWKKWGALIGGFMIGLIPKVLSMKDNEKIQNNFLSGITLSCGAYIFYMRNNSEKNYTSVEDSELDIELAITFLHEYIKQINNDKEKKNIQKSYSRSRTKAKSRRRSY